MARSNDFFRVVLPWPDWDLSPNGTTNKNKRARLTKDARWQAKILAMEAIGLGNWVDNRDQLFAIWMFCPPNNIRRDTGNMRATMKAWQDGIFDALSSDDSAIKDEYLHRVSAKKPGHVEMRLYESYEMWLDDIITISSIRYSGDQIYTVVKK